MSKVKTFLKWAALSLCALALVIAAIWTVSRAMYPTEAQREAIAEMETLPEYSGENAFALLWSLGRDVPDAELDAVVEEDVRRFSETPLLSEVVVETEDKPGTTDRHPWEFASAREDYPDLSPSAEDRSMFCNGWRDENCIDKVRENLDAYQSLIERNQTLLDRIARLENFEYISYAFPPRMTAPLPSYQPASYLRTRHAVEFASGREREAIASACREIATWRRLSANAETLIDRLVGIANSSKQTGMLLADMLARWPVDEPLPEPCDSALAPPTLADLSVCNALRGEFARVAFSARHMHEYAASEFPERWILPLVFDTEATVGESAQHFQANCGQDQATRLRADRRRGKPEEPGIARLACVGNLVGCIQNAVAQPAYVDYEDRTLDHGARLRVLGTLAWMRQHAATGRSPEQLLAARPDALKSPERDIEFGPGGQTLQVRLYETNYNSEGETNQWSIPLPPALHSNKEG